MDEHITYLKELDLLYDSAIYGHLAENNTSLATSRLKEQQQIAFLRHLDKVSKLFTPSSRNNAQSKPAPFFDSVENTPTIRIFFTDDFIIHEVNENTETLYGAQTGDHIEVLPICPSSLDLLISKHILLRSSNDVSIIRLCKLGSRSIILGTLHRRFDRRSGLWLTELRTSDFAWPSKLNHTLSSNFSLTEAEIQITQLVFEGYSIDFIADARDCVVSTVRSQLRTIYDKISCTNIVELIRLISGLIIRPESMC
ncbi:helix-turn-helix transcriptional regulator [Hirschia maritima]|uniref:helix-turn-helix transcriptional regulator n=1 Tax=Hirschia maritima TaxID=1121961 RepID=UPI0038992216